VSNPLSYIGLSDAQWQAAESAYRTLGLATPSSPAPATSSAPTLNLRSRPTSTPTTPSGRTACQIYDAAKAGGQQAAVLAALKPKCDAEKRLGTSYSSGGSSLAITGGTTTAPAPIDGKVAPPSSGPSPIVLGAIALAVAGVGFVAYQRFARKKSKR
jgi:hypothetical protein